jgi:hypothetical protein
MAQAGLDLALVSRAVARYFKLSGEEKESFKAMMLDLAEAPSVEALQAFLEVWLNIISSLAV